MKINIVRPTDGWILQRIAEAWRLPNSVCSAKPDPKADVNIWCNYAMFDVCGMQPTNCDIGWFTHWEEGSRGRVFDAVAAEVDWCISMCQKTTRFLPADRTTVIQSAPSDLYGRRELILGVVGKSAPRKRTHLIETINKPGVVSVRHSGGTWPATDMPAFYRMCDYIVVLSSNEGGPMCVPEAMAMGKPVIAPDVGWCWDYPVIRYADEADLVRVVQGLTPPTIEEESRQIMEVVNHCLS